MMSLCRCSGCRRQFYAKSDGESWCPHCGEPAIIEREQEALLESESDDDRDGSWSPIIVTVILILVFYVLFVGVDGIGEFASWFQRG